MKSFLKYIINFTWCLPQNILGLVLFSKYKGQKRERFFDTMLTYHDGSWGGVSLGMFIFVAGNRDEDWIRKAKVHEYGHYLQSLILGPFYLLIIGIPSFIWCNAKKYKDLRKNTGKSYFKFFPERWANHLGGKKPVCPPPNKKLLI